jgi:hypothetical protein
MFDELFTLESRVSFVTDQLLYLIPKMFKHPNKWNFPCPFCDDKIKHQRRGWYYLESDSYYCFNAGCVANEGHTSGFKLLSLLKNEQLSIVKKDYLMTVKDLKSILSNFKKIPTEVIKPQEKIKIPNEWVDLPPIVTKYIDDRLVYKAPSLKKPLKLFWNNETKRVVIPYIEHGKIVYYQERNLTPGKAKYVFPPDLEKQIFGLDNIDKSLDCIYLLEGAFDSIFVKNGIALGGIKITNEQKQRLDTSFFDYEKIYMFDNQNVDESSYDRIQKLAKTFPKQQVFLWPKEIKDKDVNDYVKRTKELNKFFDINFLKENTMNVLRASLMCKMWKG